MTTHGSYTQQGRLTSGGSSTLGVGGRGAGFSFFRRKRDDDDDDVITCWLSSSLRTWGGPQQHETKNGQKLKMSFSICSQLGLRSRKTEEEETEETEDRAETGETVLHHVFVQQFFRRVHWLLGHLLGADWTFGFLRPSRVSDLQVRQTCGGPVSSDHSVCQR